MLGKKRVILVLLLIIGTWSVLSFSSDIQPVPIKKSLGTFPRSLGEYSLSNTLQSSADIIEMLGVDDYIQYNYENPAGSRVNLYVGFYGAVGVTGIYHSPKNCIPGGGWGIDTVTPSILDTGIEGRETSTISQMVIRRGNQLQLVNYWYQNRGRIIASEYMEKIYQVLDALFKNRRDGTFVRVITMVEGGDIEKARAELKQFSEEAMKELENFIPGARL